MSTRRRRARLGKRDPPRGPRASHSLTCGAAPGTRTLGDSEATAGRALIRSRSHSLAASLGDPRRLPARDARGGALWRREVSRATPQTPPLAAPPASDPGWRRHVGASGLRKRWRWADAPVATRKGRPVSSASPSQFGDQSGTGRRPRFFWSPGCHSPRNLFPAITYPMRHALLPVTVGITLKTTIWPCPF